MRKRGRKLSGIIALIVVVVLVIVGVLVYFVFGSGLKCELQIPYSKIEATQGVSNSVSVSGYKGILSQVLWTSEDSSIAEVNPKSGSDTVLEMKQPGTTTITATDHFVGEDCSVSINVEVMALSESS